MQLSGANESDTCGRSVPALQTIMENGYQWIVQTTTHRFNFSLESNVSACMLETCKPQLSDLSSLSRMSGTAAVKFRIECDSGTCQGVSQLLNWEVLPRISST